MSESEWMSLSVQESRKRMEEPHLRIWGNSAPNSALRSHEPLPLEAACRDTTSQAPRHNPVLLFPPWVGCGSHFVACGSWFIACFVNGAAFKCRDPIGAPRRCPHRDPAAARTHRDTHGETQPGGAHGLGTPQASGSHRDAPVPHRRKTPTGTPQGGPHGDPHGGGTHAGPPLSRGPRRDTRRTLQGPHKRRDVLRW